MSKPQGRGAWVAFVDAMSPGGRAEDIALLVERAKRLGCSWVALRIGAAGMKDGGAHLGGAPARDLIDAIRAAGLGLYVWLFEYADHRTAGYPIWEAWAPIADGAIINAEFEYLKASKEQAEALVEDLYTMGYDYVAHAPPDYAGGRGDGAMKYLDAVCDEIMPQVYAYEHDDRGHVAHLDAVRALYEKRGIPIEKVSPIGCTYRPRTRGFDGAGKGIPTKPIGDEPVARDVVAFLDHPWTRASSAPSLYSLDGLTFAGEGREAVLAAVEAHDAAHHRDTDPAPFDPTPPALRLHPDEVPALEDLLATLADDTDTPTETPTSKSQQMLAVKEP
ncbi:MAG: hypothetical protein ACRC4O_05360 [Giesbergeria sp.]